MELCPTVQGPQSLVPREARVMRTVCLWLAALLVCSAVMAPMPEASAQPVGVDPNRDCQTLLTCRFTRGGIYRGCLSSYSCRVCSLVAAPCRLDPGSRVCQQMRCTWG
jgi:hypothetical protein